MRKYLIIFCLLFLTGCRNEFVCTFQTEEENYKTEQKMNFEFDKNDKITNATINYTMIFETEKDAEMYFKIYENIEKDYEIKFRSLFHSILIIFMIKY